MEGRKLSYVTPGGFKVTTSRVTCPRMCHSSSNYTPSPLLPLLLLLLNDIIYIFIISFLFLSSLVFQIRHTCIHRFVSSISCSVCPSVPRRCKKFNMPVNVQILLDSSAPLLFIRKLIASKGKFRCRAGKSIKYIDVCVIRPFSSGVSVKIKCEVLFEAFMTLGTTKLEVNVHE